MLRLRYCKSVAYEDHQAIPPWRLAVSVCKLDNVARGTIGTRSGGAFRDKALVTQAIDSTMNRSHEENHWQYHEQVLTAELKLNARERPTDSVLPGRWHEADLTLQCGPASMSNQFPTMD
jgi:hypothetical protein